VVIRTNKAVVQSAGGLAVCAQAREFEIAIDEPKSIGGTNTGMTPAELVLSALGACQTIVALAFAKRWGIAIQEYRVEVEGDIDTDGYKGLSDVRSGYLEIRYRVYVKSEAPQDRVREYVRFVERICPVGDTIANPVRMVLEEIRIDS